MDRTVSSHHHFVVTQKQSTGMHVRSAPETPIHHSHDQKFHPASLGAFHPKHSVKLLHNLLFPINDLIIQSSTCSFYAFMKSHLRHKYLLLTSAADPSLLSSHTHIACLSSKSINLANTNACRSPKQQIHYSIKISNPCSLPKLLRTLPIPLDRLFMCLPHPLRVQILPPLAAP